MSARVLTLLATAFAVGLVGAAPALASLTQEVSAGKAVAAELQRGNATCKSLSDAQFEHLGEYVMDHMVGSRSAHAAMNERMAAAIGAENTDRMHELMGRRFAGCAGGTAGSVPMGPGMMHGTGTGSGSGGWGAMMGSSNWSWMHDGSWRHMSRANWQSAAQTMMGARYATPSRDGWSTAAVLAAVSGALLLGGLVVFAAVRRPWRRPPAAPRPA